MVVSPAEKKDVEPIDAAARFVAAKSDTSCAEVSAATTFACSSACATPKSDVVDAEAVREPVPSVGADTSTPITAITEVVPPPMDTSALEATAARAGEDSMAS
jgi:hypothetical protein